MAVLKPRNVLMLALFAAGGLVGARYFTASSGLTNANWTAGSSLPGPLAARTEASAVGSAERARQAVRAATERVTTSAEARPQDPAVANRELLGNVARELAAIGPDPLRSQIESGILADFIDRQGGLRLAKEVLQHPDETFATYGDEQASIRALCLSAMDQAGKEHLGDVVETLQSLAAYLASAPEWKKGLEYDYRDLLYTYFTAKGFDAIESDPERFLQDIGHDARVAQLARKVTLQFFDNRIDDSRLYPVLRRIGGPT